MAYLSWISDEKLLAALKEFAAALSLGDEKNAKDSGRNVIDPFATIFTLSFFKMNHEHWIQMEEFRKKDKTLTNALGTFHQQVLGSVDGWQDLGTKAVVDLVNDDRKIIAEVKNKYNTVKGSDKINIYNALHSCIYDKVSRFRGYQAYYVTIIPQKPEGILRPFVPSDNKSGTKPADDPSIMEIDGKRFYALVTGCETALEDLFKVLPTILASTHFHLLLDDKSKAMVVKLFHTAYH